MGVMAGANTAGPDREVATAELNRELQDKGFILTTTEDIINWARNGSLHWMTFGLACRAAATAARTPSTEGSPELLQISTPASSRSSFSGDSSAFV